MYSLNYLRPGSLPEALSALAQHAEAKPLSGGMTLVPTLKQRLAAPTHLVDLTRLSELQGITFADGVLRVGAATPHAQVAASPVVRNALPALADLAGQIADPQVRSRGTMGGSLANNDPAADYPAAMLGLGGTVVTDRRRIVADDYFTGMFSTALEEGELIVALEYTPPRRATYAKRRHPASGYAMVGVFIAQRDSGVRVAVTGAASSVFRWDAAEQALQRRLHPDALNGVPLDGIEFPGDVHADPAYRAHLVEVYTRRAVAALLDSPEVS